MFRIKLILIIGGGVLIYFGVREFIVGQGTSSEPVQTDLAKLEAGEKPKNNYVIIGEHVAVYPQVVYSYSTSRYSSAEPNASTSINYSYYPILSRNHPYIKTLDSLIRKHGGIQKIPDDVDFPQIENVAVLVKTERFDTIGSIPMSIDDEASVKGLIINDIDSLGSDEERVVRQGLPNIDMDKVLILEHDREPASFLKWAGLTGGGVLLALVGIGLFFYKGKSVQA